MTIKAYRGKGVVSAGLFSSGANFAARTLFPLGNASDFAFSFEIDKQTIPNFQNAAGGDAAAIIRVSSFNGTIALRELSDTNLAMLLAGTTTAKDATAIVGESGYKIVPSAFIRTSRLIDTAVAPVVKKGATTILAADYSVNPGGITISPTITTGSVASGDAITIDYTPKLSHKVQPLLTTPVDYSLSFVGYNEADGKSLIVDVYKLKFSPPRNIQLIGTDFFSAECDFTAVADPTIVGAELSQYANIEVED